MTLRIFVVTVAVFTAFFMSSGNAAPKRWTPGPGMLLYTGTSDSAKVEQVMELENEPQVKNIMARFYWNAIQTGPTTFDWTATDNFINACASIGKTCFIFGLDKGFTGSPNANSCNAPQYIKDMTDGCTETNTGGIPSLHKQVVRDEYIKFVEAVANRYDSNPGFGGMNAAESANSIGNAANPPADYSKEAWADALIDIAERASAAFDQAVWMTNVNFLTNLEDDIIEGAITAGAGLTWPDTLPDVCSVGPTEAQNYLTNEKQPSDIAVMGMVQGPEMQNTANNPARGLCNVQELVAEHQRLGYTHIFWLRLMNNDAVREDGTPGITWPDDILPAIRSGNTYFNDICPTNFEDGCVGYEGEEPAAPSFEPGAVGIVCVGGQCFAPTSIPHTSTRYAPGAYWETTVGDTNPAGKCTAIKDSSSVTGIVVPLYWSDIQTARSTFNWSKPDSVIDACMAAGKQVFFRIKDRTGTVGDQCKAPKYVRDFFNGTGCMSTNYADIPSYHRVGVIDNLISFYKYVAIRYDHLPVFQGLITEKTDGIPNPVPDEYSESRVTTHIGRIFKEVPKVMRNSILVASVDSVDRDISAQWVKDAYEGGAMLGSAEIKPPSCASGCIDSQTEYRQFYQGVNEWPTAYTVTPQAFNGSPNSCTVEEIFDEFEDLNASYAFITNAWSSLPLSWNGDFLPALDQGELTVSLDCPDNFEQGCSYIFPRNVLRLDTTNLLPKPIASTTYWTSVTTTTAVDLDLNVYNGLPGVEVSSGGALSNRLDSGDATLVAGETYHVKVMYRGGTSGNARITIEEPEVPQTTAITGAVGAVAIGAENAGTVTNLVQGLGQDGVTHVVTFDFVPLLTSVYQVGIGPFSETVGENIIALYGEFSE